MVVKYRKKPALVEAVHWTGENQEEVMQLLNPFGAATLNPGSYMWRQLVVGSTGHPQVPDVGDWIVPHPDGYHLSCVKPDVFNATYEQVSLVRETANEVLGGVEL